MNDPLDPLTPDEDFLAVSALLDGTATADARARVDADPALQDLLIVLRTQRAELADVPADEGIREQAIARALAAFDDLQSSTAEDDRSSADASVPVAVQIASAPHLAPSPTNVVRLERRRSSYRILTGAAAAVGVLFIGVLAIGALGSTGGRDESASLASDPAAAKAAPGDIDDPATPMLETAQAETAVASDSGTQGAFGTTSPAATESADASQAAEEPAITEAPASGGSIAVIGGPANLSIAITTAQQLLDYANTQQPILPLPGLAFPCVADGMQAIGEATYQGVQVIVVRDPVTGAVQAFDYQDGCSLVAAATP